MQKKYCTVRSLLAAGLIIFLAAGIVSGATVTRNITYQGKLTDAAGSPLTGTYTATLGLYPASTGGTALWADTHSVQCINGLFTTTITSSPSLFNGQALWLGIKAGADPEMTPRQEIRPVPYALGLRPDALLQNLHVGSAQSGTGPIGNAAINATTNNDWNPGVVVNTTGFSSMGFRATTRGPFSSGFYTQTYGQSATAIQGYAYGTSADGVIGYSTNGTGVYGESVNDIGIYGKGKTGGYFTTGQAAPTGSQLPGIKIQTSYDRNPGLLVQTYGQNSHGVSSTTSGDFSPGIYADTMGTSSSGIIASTSGSGSKGISVFTYGGNSPGIYEHTFGDASDAIDAFTDGENSRGLNLTTMGDGSMGVFSTARGAYSGGFYAQTYGKYATAIQGYAYGPAVSLVDPTGIVGYSTNGTGAYGESRQSTGVYGKGKEGGYFTTIQAGNMMNTYPGVNVSTAFAHNPGVSVRTTGANSPGIIASSQQSEGIIGNAVHANGVVGHSDYAYGVIGDTNSGTYGVFTNDRMYAEYGFVGPHIDIAEYMAATGNLMPGTVVIIGDDGRIHESATAYDTRVAGIVSTTPGVILGTKLEGNPGEAQVAIAGRVPCKVDAGFDPIHPGDLLSTSATPGHAMKAKPITIEGMTFYPSGIVLGKSMGTIDSGTGTIDVLVTLQ